MIEDFSTLMLLIREDIGNKIDEVSSISCTERKLVITTEYSLMLLNFPMDCFLNLTPSTFTNVSSFLLKFPTSVFRNSLKHGLQCFSR